MKMELVEALKAGEVAIDEPDLALLIEEALKSGAFIPRTHPSARPIYL